MANNDAPASRTNSQAKNVQRGCTRWHSKRVRRKGRDQPYLLGWSHCAVALGGGACRAALEKVSRQNFQCCHFIGWTCTAVQVCVCAKLKLVAISVKWCLLLFYPSLLSQTCSEACFIAVARCVGSFFMSCFCSSFLPANSGQSLSSCRPHHHFHHCRMFLATRSKWFPRSATFFRRCIATLPVTSLLSFLWLLHCLRICCAHLIVAATQKILVRFPSKHAPYLSKTSHDSAHQTHHTCQRRVRVGCKELWLPTRC